MLSGGRVTLADRRVGQGEIKVDTLRQEILDQQFLTGKRGRIWIGPFISSVQVPRGTVFAKGQREHMPTRAIVG